MALLGFRRKSIKNRKKYCSRLYKQERENGERERERENLFEKFNLSFFADNKKIWKIVKPLFKGKTSGVSDEVLLEKDKILPDDTEELHWYLKKELHWYFNSIVSSLGITENKFAIEKNGTSCEAIEKPVMKFQFHPSILLIKSKINKINRFSFREIKTHDVNKKYVH